MFKKLSKIKRDKGMTLVELIVVLGIFVLVTGITIFDYNSFRSNISLQNLADEIALSVRKAQSYAIGVKSAGGSFSDNFGIHFSKEETGGSENNSSSKSFVLFVDIDKDNKYNPSDICGVGEEECLEILTIKTEDKITGILREGELDENLETIDVIFKRPNPDANFYDNGDYVGEQSIGIQITNTRSGGVKNIIISNTGQISIE
jgi:prepilin-type N-terminal cleavage/methylation domain-containing protein